MTSSTETPVSRMARLFHALSDETRLSILSHLRRGEHCVCELTDSLESGQSRLSFHLKVLKDAGIIQDRKEGRWVHYSVVPGVLDALGEDLRELRFVPAGRKAGACCG